MVNLLRTFERVSEVKDAENGKELLDTYQVCSPPDVAIVDLQMPIMDGSETCENIIQQVSRRKDHMLTMHDSGKFILHMMDMGVHAFLLKNSEPDELEKAIYAVAEKDFYHNELVAAVLAKKCEGKKNRSRTICFKQVELTEREKEILLTNLSGAYHERDRTTTYS